MTTTRRYIKELAEQDVIDQVFLVADKQLRVNRQGGKYILLRLADRTGNLVGMHWNADDRIFDSFQRGDYLHCKGRTQIHNGNLQIIVSHFDQVPVEQVDIGEFDSFDSEAAESLFCRLQVLFESLTEPRLVRLAQSFLADGPWLERLKLAPAAVTNHHAFPGGLLQHTIDLMELVQLVAPRYQKIDRQILLLGAFLHDLGKIDELTSGGELAYTDPGQLVGHIVIGVQLLNRHIDAIVRDGCEFEDSLRWQLEHLIISHHGLLEFGSPKLPMTLEAIALHHLDNLDAKLASAAALIDADVSGDRDWTNFNPAMGRKMWKGNRA